MLDEFTLGIVAIAAGVLILIGWVPQIIQGYKTKKLEDVSKYLGFYEYQFCVLSAFSVQQMTFEEDLKYFKASLPNI